MSDSWVPGADGSGFGADNLPYGVFSRRGTPPRVGVRIADRVLDLAGLLGEPEFLADSLIPFLARGSTSWRAVRARVAGMLTRDKGRDRTEAHLVPLAEAAVLPPFPAAGRTVVHGPWGAAAAAPNGAGASRPPAPRRGRPGTVLPPGTGIALPGGAAPGRLGCAAGLGFVVGAPVPPGRAVPVTEFAEHVFGVVVVIGWTLGGLREERGAGEPPGTPFAVSASHWVVPLDALGAARRPGRAQEPPPLPHLRRGADWGLDITLETRVNGEAVARTPFAAAYWTADQLLAHLTRGGTALRTGDLYTLGPVAGERPRLGDGDTVAVAAGAPGMAGGVIDLGGVAAAVRAA